MDHGSRVTPEISVVVASHDRPLRLRWLLNALEVQTLAPGRWEVIVGHDSAGPETDALLRDHPLARAGVLRSVRLAPGSAPPGANRNAAWRIARAPVVAFTDDDCRPPPDWLEKALEAAGQHPGAIVQGRTLPDPVEGAIEHATHYHSRLVVPPTPWAQCCNIMYPRDVLERVGGFAEDAYTGEDTDLALRARAAGTRYVAAGDVLTYHAVVEMSLAGRLRDTWRWQDMPLLVKRHPELRRVFPLWVFWAPTHVWLPFFLLGVFLGRRRGLAWTALCVPWFAHGAPRHGDGPRGRYRTFLEIPARLAIDLCEFAALTRGSARQRTLFL